MRWKKLTISFFVAVLAIPALLMPTKRAYAFFGCTPIPTPPPTPIGPFVPVYDGATAIQQSFNNIFNSSVFQKQCILDGLVKILAKSLINNLTGSIVDWINKDFQGGPAFITNPAGFFVNIADETAGEFIETQLGPIGQLLCSPFDLRLRINLSLATVASRKQYLGCRLSEIEKNAYSAFTNGGFIANGGWRTFNAMTSDPRNNQFGAYIMASDALNTEFIKKANEKLRELSYGRGFLSYKKCTAYSTKTNATGGHDCTQYQTLTPGSVIESQLGNALGTDLRQYELADNFNAILGAVVNYGLRQVFSSGGGLLSASSQNAGGASPSAEKLRNNDFSELYKLADAPDPNIDKVHLAADTLSGKDETANKVGSTTATKVELPSEKNIAKGKSARQSSDYMANNFIFEAKLAVDGQTGSWYTASITADDKNPWWEVDLGKSNDIDHIDLYTDPTRPIRNGCIIVSETANAQGNQCTGTGRIAFSSGGQSKMIVPIRANGQFVRILGGGDNLILIDVQIFQTESSVGGSNAPGITTPSAAVPMNAGNTDANNQPITVGNEAALESVFTANQPTGSPFIRVTLQQKNGDVFVNYAPGSVFSSFTLRIKNPDTGQLAFEEKLIDQKGTGANTIAEMQEAKPYTLPEKDTVDAKRGDRVSIGYQFTATSAARGREYRLITESANLAGTPSGGIAQIIQFSVAP